MPSEFDEEEQRDQRAELERTKRLLGSMLGEAYQEMIKRVINHAEEITLAEWTELIGKWLQRPETVESFNRAIAFARTNPVLEVPVGKHEIVKVPMNPGSSRSFIEAFLTFVAVDLKVLWLDKMKDQLGYYAFLLAGRKPKRERRRVTPMEELGL